jgi:hypothetical protein
MKWECTYACLKEKKGEDPVNERKNKVKKSQKKNIK